MKRNTKRACVFVHSTFRLFEFKKNTRTRIYCSSLKKKESSFVLCRAVPHPFVVGIGEVGIWHHQSFWLFSDIVLPAYSTGCALNDINTLNDYNSAHAYSALWSTIKL